MLSIKQRQLNLKTYYDYYRGNIDGIEGTGTKNAYRNFQKGNGLTADGIYGSNTNNKLILCIKDLQSLLNKYGYNLAVDGIVGNATINAIKNFQSKNGLGVDGIAGTNTYAKLRNVPPTPKPGYVPIGYKSKYCKPSEFTCKCGCGLNRQKSMIQWCVDYIREKYNRPIYINSATRCIAHNKAVGGVSNSFHLYGNAVDIQLNGVSGSELLKTCQELIKMGKARYAYIIGGSAVHLDTGNLE